MWISEKTAQIQYAGSFGSHVGIVSVGGKNPAVVTQGESRSAEIACPGGIIYIPKVGDEVLLERTCDEERIILAAIPASVPGGLSEGDIYISAGEGSGIHIRRGGIEISGNIRITGNTAIDGTLLINGKPCAC